jgi:hypothetical protein
MSTLASFADHVAFAPSTLRVLADMSRRRHAILAAPRPVLYPDGTVLAEFGPGLYGDNDSTVDMVDTDNDVVAGWFNDDGIVTGDHPCNEIAGLHVMTASEAAVSMLFPNDSGDGYSEEFLADMEANDILDLCNGISEYCGSYSFKDAVEIGLFRYSEGATSHCNAERTLLEIAKEWRVTFYKYEEE